MTEWRTIRDWPAYEVSDTGRVRRVVAGKRGGFVGERKPYLTKTGYVYIVLRNGDEKCALGVHRLVCEAFHGPSPFDGAQALHYDGDKQHNHKLNVRWGTRSENEQDKIRHVRSNRGERQGRSRLKPEQVQHIRILLAEGRDPVEIASGYAVARQTINSIRSGQSWSWLT